MNFLKRNKRIKILTIINILLIIVLVFSLLPKNQKENFITPLLQKQQLDEIQEIILTIPDNSFPVNFNIVRLLKKNQEFIFYTGADTEIITNKYKVSKNVIDRLFTTLNTAQNFIFVSDSPKRFSNFDLDKDKAIQMQIIGENKTILREFFFGKQDTLGTNRFVRIDSRTKVFIVQDFIAPFLTFKRNFWIDLQIYKETFSKNKIQSIQKDARHIIRSQNNNSEFNELELFLKQFSCIDIFPASPPVSIKTKSIKLFLGNGDEHKIEITPTESGDYILFDFKLGNAFIISAYTKKRIDGLIENLF